MPQPTRSIGRIRLRGGHDADDLPGVVLDDDERAPIWISYGDSVRLARYLIQASAQAEAEGFLLVFLSNVIEMHRESDRARTQAHFRTTEERTFTLHELDISVSSGYSADSELPFVTLRIAGVTYQVTIESARDMACGLLFESMGAHQDMRMLAFLTRLMGDEMTPELAENTLRLFAVYRQQTQVDQRKLNHPPALTA